MRELKQLPFTCLMQHFILDRTKGWMWCALSHLNFRHEFGLAV